MMEFFQTLKARNETLLYFGALCWLLAIGFLVLARLHPVQVAGANAWLKPFKFAASTALYAWAMAWYLGYLPQFNPTWFNWGIIVLLGFEIVYIAIQAGRGQLSHYNMSSPFYGAMYSMMALAATLATLLTAYVGLLFFTGNVVPLPAHYLWSIRAGIFIFVVFSFEGFVMGGRLTHTIGGPDGGPGLPLVGWSTRFGDPRVAHFIGMHALQVLPIATFYLLRNTVLSLMVTGLYGLLAAFTLWQALQGRPLLRLQDNAAPMDAPASPNDHLNP